MGGVWNAVPGAAWAALRPRDPAQPAGAAPAQRSRRHSADRRRRQGGRPPARHNRRRSRLNYRPSHRCHR